MKAFENEKERIIRESQIEKIKRYESARVSNRAINYPYYYSVKEANKVIKFVELLTNTNTGEPIKLLPFQKWILGSLYGWRDEKDNGRRWTKAVISFSPIRRQLFKN